MTGNKLFYCLAFTSHADDVPPGTPPELRWEVGVFGFSTLYLSVVCVVVAMTTLSLVVSFVFGLLFYRQSSVSFSILFLYFLVLSLSL